MLTSKEIAKSTRTLICFLQSLVNHKVLVELRNDLFVLGILQSVDCYMNSELSSAHIYSLDSWIDKLCEKEDCNDDEIIIQTDHPPDSQWVEKQTKVDYLFIKGCRIRYFYVPEKTNVIDCIEQQLGVYRRRRTIGIERPFNWKIYRKKLKLVKNENLTKSGDSNLCQSSSFK